jgi:hypothetical protein
MKLKLKKKLKIFSSHAIPRGEHSLVQIALVGNAAVEHEDIPRRLLKRLL